MSDQEAEYLAMMAERTGLSVAQVDRLIKEQRDVEHRPADLDAVVEVLERVVDRLDQVLDEMRQRQR